MSQKEGQYLEEEYTLESAEKIGETVVYAVQKSRQAKSEKNLSLKSPLKDLFVEGKISNEEFELAKDDLIGATKIENVSYNKLKDDSEIDYEARVDVQTQPGWFVPTSCSLLITLLIVQASIL